MATQSKIDPVKISDTGEAPAPGYVEWKRAKVLKAMHDARDRSTLIPAEQV